MIQGAETTMSSSSTSANGYPNSYASTSAIPDEILDRLGPESRSCIERLRAHKTPPEQDYGIVKRGAVLVALYQPEGSAELRVLLTTRARTMRTHPNITALPGGRVDAEDPSPIHTAYREANEEVGFPLPPHPSIHHLAVLEPVITILPLNAHMRGHIIVTPVVCFVSDLGILSILTRNPLEVDHIFSHRLKGCHDGTVPPEELGGLAPSGGEWWPHPEDLHSQDNRLGTMGPYRMHRFRTSHSPIKGLTSDVLINTATTAYDSPPSFTRFAPGQLSFADVIARVVAELPAELEREANMPAEEKAKLKSLPLEWGNLESGERIRSGETWHERG